MDKNSEKTPCSDDVEKSLRLAEAEQATAFDFDFDHLHWSMIAIIKDYHQASLIILMINRIFIINVPIHEKFVKSRLWFFTMLTDYIR